MHELYTAIFSGINFFKEPVMSTHNNFFEWAVIGAGPAGIATIGKLIDQGVPPKQIAWFDPEFKVGDLGSKWRNVSSNTTVKLFLKFLSACKAFDYAHCPHNFAINQLQPEETCDLYLIADPLQWVTDHLRKQVFSKETTVNKLNLHNRHWEIHDSNNVIFAKNVILAPGAHPKSLTFPDIEEISLEVALDKNQLKNVCGSNDIVAVFGSSHSAIIALRNLLESNVKQVINFYRNPLCYATYFDDWILFDDTGLKGHTAEWARNNIDGKLPDQLTRIFSSSENISQHLPQCNKAIYAVGFARRTSLIIENFPHLNYNPHNGIIAPGLFGIGIAYPEAKIDRYGTLEYRVGLWKFMDYLNHILPLWLKYHV